MHAGACITTILKYVLSQVLEGHTLPLIPQLDNLLHKLLPMPFANTACNPWHCGGIWSIQVVVELALA